MTNFEKYMYETRQREFFDMIYKSEPIVTLIRRDYKDTPIFISENAFCVNIGWDEPKQLVNVSNQNIDYMAHLYASNQLHNLKDFIKDEIKYSSYIPEHFQIIMDLNVRHYYSEETIEEFHKINEKYLHSANQAIEIDEDSYDLD